MKIKMNLGGNAIEAEKMEFKPIEENWSLYRLEDGTVVKIKLIVSDVFKLHQGEHQHSEASSRI